MEKCGRSKKKKPKIKFPDTRMTMSKMKNILNGINKILQKKKITETPNIGC